jgi:hypothetical protein
MEPATEDEVRGLLPVRAYSQRQLSDVGVDLDELTRFVTAPIRDQLDALDGRRDELAGEIRENFVHLQRMRTLERTIARDRLSHESLGQQAAAVRETLGGLSEDDQAVLRAKPGYDQADALVNNWASRLKQATDEVERVSETVGKLADGTASSVDPELPEQDAISAVQNEVRTLLANADTALRATVTSLRSGTAAGWGLDTERAAWSERYARFNAQYDDATGRSTSHAEKLEELEALEVRRRELQESLDSHSQQLQLLGDRGTAHARLREAWRSLQEERTTILAEQCKTLSDLSDQLISAMIRAGAGTGAQQQRFKAELQGSGVRSVKIEAFLAAVAAGADPLAEWHAALDELESIVLAEGDLTITPVASTSLKAFAASDLARMVPKLTPEAILELSLLGLDDHPVFEYRAKEGEHIAFADAWDRATGHRPAPGPAQPKRAAADHRRPHLESEEPSPADLLQPQRQTWSSTAMPNSSPASTTAQAVTTPPARLSSKAPSTSPPSARRSPWSWRAARRRFDCARRSTDSSREPLS